MKLNNCFIKHAHETYILIDYVWHYFTTVVKEIWTTFCFVYT